MNAKPPVATLTIGRLAQLGGVNLETIRYYEQEGLLPRPPRTRSGYRIFPTDPVRRLRFIKRARKLGFSLTEIENCLRSGSHVFAAGSSRRIPTTLTMARPRCEHEQFSNQPCGARQLQTAA